MKAYLMRHATAEEAGGAGDAARRLSDQGRREAQEAADALRQGGARPAIVRTSPRLRARETAEIVAAALGIPVEVRQALDSGATAAAYLDGLGPIDGPDVLVVGHNPEISVIASALAEQPVSFRPSTVCCLALGADSAELEWLRHP